MDTRRSARVVVGLDTTLSGLHALRRAVAEARRRGLPLRVVRAWNPGPTGAYPMLPDPHQEEAAAAARQVNTAFAETMGGIPPDLSVETVLVADNPGPVLIRHADQDDDLLVIGTGRRRRFSHRLSRTTRYCLARAACPVLVVPPPALARAGSQRALFRRLRREIEELASGAEGAR